MKIFLPLILLLASLSSFSQQWCPPGATWTYNYYYIDNTSPRMDYTRYSYTKDTIVQNQQCALLTGIAAAYVKSNQQVHTAPIAPIYTFGRNDSVFLWQDELQIFSPVYFFNAKVGDTVQYKSVKNYCIDAKKDSTITQVVDSTGIIEVNGKSLRYYVARIVGTEVYGASTKIIERLGMIDNYMNPFYVCATDLDAYTLRCYEDDSLTLYKTSSTNCDQVYIPLSVNDNSEQISVTIYPNPVSESFQLQLSETPQQETYFQLFDELGRPVKQQVITELTATIHREQMTNGIYFWQLEQEGKIVSRGKVILQ